MKHAMSFVGKEGPDFPIFLQTPVFGRFFHRTVHGARGKGPFTQLRLSMVRIDRGAEMRRRDAQIYDYLFF